MNIRFSLIMTAAFGLFLSVPISHTSSTDSVTRTRHLQANGMRMNGMRMNSLPENGIPADNPAWRIAKREEDRRWMAIPLTGISIRLPKQQGPTDTRPALQRSSTRPQVDPK